MALILKIQEFHFGFVDMKVSEEKKRRYIKVFHMKSVVTIARRLDISSAMSDSQCRAVCETPAKTDIHTCVDLRAAFTQNHR